MLPSKEGEEGQGVGLARRRMPSSEWQWRAMADERRKRFFPLCGVGATVCRAGCSFQRWSLKARAGERGRGRMRVYNQRFASERLRLQLNARCTDLRKHQETIPVTWGCKETPPKELYVAKSEETCSIHVPLFTINRSFSPGQRVHFQIYAVPIQAWIDSFLAMLGVLVSHHEIHHCAQYYTHYSAKSLRPDSG